MNRSKLLLFVVSAVFMVALGTPSTKAAQGTGILYVYSDSGYTTLVSQDEHGFYEVMPGDTVYIQIAGITEFEIGDYITVKICWEDLTEFIEDVEVKTLSSGVRSGEVGVGDAVDPIQWTVGWFDGVYHEIPPCETITVHYKGQEKPPGPDYVVTWYDADKGMSTVAHLHVVPENPLGILGTISVLFIGLWAYSLGRRRIPGLSLA